MNYYLLLRVIKNVFGVHVETVGRFIPTPLGFSNAKREADERHVLEPAYNVQYQVRTDTCAEVLHVGQGNLPSQALAYDGKAQPETD